MRRNEYYSTDPADFEFVISTARIGYLGILTPDGYPRVVPVNFAANLNTIYFHGATAGEKYQVLKAIPKVTFSADVPYSIIPSYWISGASARGATVYYKSILIKGLGKVVENVHEKCGALQLLMEKYQPEGKFTPIAPSVPAYEEILIKTAVFRVDADHIEVKDNFPKDKPREFKEKLIALLEARAQGPDLATAQELKKLL